MSYQGILEFHSTFPTLGRVSELSLLSLIGNVGFHPTIFCSPILQYLQWQRYNGSTTATIYSLSNGYTERISLELVNRYRLEYALRRVGELGLSALCENKMFITS